MTLPTGLVDFAGCQQQPGRLGWKVSRVAWLRRDQPTIDQRLGRNVLMDWNDAAIPESSKYYPINS